MTVLFDTAFTYPVNSYRVSFETTQMVLTAKLGNNTVMDTKKMCLEGICLEVFHYSWTNC